MATAAHTIDEEVQARFALRDDLAQDPYPLYARLREESPVHRFGSSTVLVSRHADAKAVYREEDRFHVTAHRGSSTDTRYSLLTATEIELKQQIHRIETDFMPHKDGADHRRVRGAAQRLFMRGRIVELERLIQELADELLDALAAGPEPDLVPVAYRLPLLVGTALIGAPREDADRLKGGSDALFSTTAVDPIRPETVWSAHAEITEFREYARELAARHRREASRTELAAALAAATVEDRLTEDELLSMYLGLLAAGHETTANLIGNGVAALLADRAGWELLPGDPALVPQAVEELLRHDPPVQLFPRVAAVDTELSGVPIAAGTRLIVVNGAANCDPRVFPDPDRLDLTRPRGDHLSFGYGAHLCLGAALARAKARIFLTTLLRRYPDLELAVPPDELVRRPHRVLRGLASLPLALGPRSERHEGDDR